MDYRNIVLQWGMMKKRLSLEKCAMAHKCAITKCNVAHFFVEFIADNGSALVSFGKGCVNHFGQLFVFSHTGTRAPCPYTNALPRSASRYNHQTSQIANQSCLVIPFSPL